MRYPLECLQAVSTDYRKHSQLENSLMEEYFDAKNVIKHLLERALSFKYFGGTSQWTPSIQNFMSMNPAASSWS